MKIALIGYGRMGKAIEKVAFQRGHEVVLRITGENAGKWSGADLSDATVAIEFTRPEAAADNILKCIEAGIPCVSGTTGWLERYREVKDSCLKNHAAFFYSGNFSIGVNIFFEINRRLAELMNHQAQYDQVLIHETHHIHKRDAPSGTAISLAEQIITHIQRLKLWRNYSSFDNITSRNSIEGEIPVVSTREDEIPGTHSVKYVSGQDEIEIIHKAHGREGFATGVLLASEFLPGKQGVFGMNDLLRF